VAEAWPIAWKKLGSLREAERLRPWLVSVAANQARQLLRKRNRRAVVELEVGERDSLRSSVAWGREGDLDLANALAKLKPEDRTLLALRYVAGFDATELGRAMGLSAAGVRTRLSRLLDRLRTELRDA